MNRRPYAWEKSYPGAARWDAPIVTTTLQEMLDRAVAAYGERRAFSYRDRTLDYRRLQRLSRDKRELIAEERRKASAARREPPLTLGRT